MWDLVQTDSDDMGDEDLNFENMSSGSEDESDEDFNDSFGGARRPSATEVTSRHASQTEEEKLSPEILELLSQLPTSSTQRPTSAADIEASAASVLKEFGLDLEGFYPTKEENTTKDRATGSTNTGLARLQAAERREEELQKSGSRTIVTIVDVRVVTFSSVA